jgi:hypothetical protein
MLTFSEAEEEEGGHFEKAGMNKTLILTCISLSLSLSFSLYISTTLSLSFSFSFILSLFRTAGNAQN